MSLFCYLSELLKRNDAVVQEALGEKQRLVAQILHVPHTHYTHIAEMAGDVAGDREAREIVLASIHQATKLTALINEGISMPDADHPNLLGASVGFVERGK